jgi:thiol-disulfide isomerase/thioredoxin
MILERILILVAVTAAFGLAWALLRARQARRLADLAEAKPFVGLVPTGGPAVVAFTLPGCIDCRARQAPALRRLAERIGPQATITTLQADEHPELTARLGLLTVPATAIVDAHGGLRHLNQGFADEERLASQLAALT